MALSLTDETTIFYMEILTFDLVVNILCRLPVKILMKLRCVCKSWNSLISDPKFAKEHLRLSRTLLNRHHLLYFSEFLLLDSRLSSISSSTSTTFPQTQLIFPLRGVHGLIIDSCNGIICFCYSVYLGSILVWNPSIRKFKILPSLEKELQQNAAYGFGYDRLIDSYKVVSVSCYRIQIDISNNILKTEVWVHTLGTDTWRSIQSFPSALQGFPVKYSGKFVSGAINWLICTAPSSWHIVSLDLGNETSQELSLPNHGGADMTMGVLRDCLCILAHTDAFVIHVWLMKDYGNKESWTELFTTPSNGLLSPRPRPRAFAHYILEDDQLLMDYEDVVFVYNPKNGTLKIPEIQYAPNYWYNNHVYIESLISP